VQTRAPYPIPIAEVPKGHVWVEGDNKDGRKTLDSLHYGPISMSLIQGKVTHIVTFEFPTLLRFNSIRWWEFKGRTRVIKRKEEFD
jgi:inner membrane protease subunit 2